MRTAEFSLSAGAAFAALQFGGDPMLMAAALLAAFAFSTIGIVTVPTFSRFSKIIGCIAILFFVVAEGCLLYWHSNSNVSPQMGPHLEFTGIKSDHADGYYIPYVGMSNTSEIPAISYAMSYSIFILPSDNIGNYNSIRDNIEEIKKQPILLDMSRNSGMNLTRGMGLSLKSNKISESDIDAVNSGTSKMYIILIASYIGELTPPDRMWITEICAQIEKPFSDFKSCPGDMAHNNEYYYSGRNLNKMH